MDVSAGRKKAVVFIRSIPHWLLVRTASPFLPGLATGPLSCLRYRDVEEPALPGPDWVRVVPRYCGICGSDLSAIACQGSPYFSPFVSTPFIPGHEIAGTLAEKGAGVGAEWKVGDRVVIEPALGCLVRGISPPCTPCAQGDYAHCLKILEGSIAGGIQTGYCRSTGGGWGPSLVAHHSQLHLIPDTLDDQTAVLAEPFSCSLHAALLWPRRPQAQILVIGCGTIGLLGIAAYRATGGEGHVLASARYQAQAEMAKRLGADEVGCHHDFEKLFAWIAQHQGASLHRPELGKPVALGGMDTVVDCVGSATSIDDGLRLAAPKGQFFLAGMPGIPKGIDWTSLWYKELTVRGVYAYGWEEIRGQRIKTMAAALDILAKEGKKWSGLVNRVFPLAQYRLALDEAFHAGSRKAFKVVFRMD